MMRRIFLSLGFAAVTALALVVWVGLTLVLWLAGAVVSGFRFCQGSR